MIQQQYYTRSLKGLYSSTPGYDTVAKSKGLSDNFVIDVLHPLCNYNPPIELTYSNNGNLDIFPQALTCIQTLDGTMVLGRIIYTGVDSIGFRNTFFAHNYVIPKDEKDDLLKDISKLFYVDSFMKKYAASEGVELPTISELSFHGNSGELNDIDTLFSKLKIDGTIYKKILAALFLSSLNNKCIYVSLNVGASEFTACSKGLMEKLLLALPYELRKRIGFVTYSREPKKMQHINIMFVEKGGITINNSDEINTYIFDLSKEIYTNVNIDVDKHYFLEYIWRNLRNQDKLIEFHELAQSMLRSQSESLKYSLDFYNQLAVMCDLKEGNEEYYKENKGECFKGVYDLCSLQYIENKEWIRESFLTMFKREIHYVENIEGYISPITFIETLLNYYDEASLKHQERIFEIISISLINSNEVGNSEYSLNIMEKIRVKENFFRNFITTIYESKRLRKSIVLWYVEESFKKINTINDMFNEIIFWFCVSYRIVAHRTFHDVVKLRFVRIIDKQQDKVAATNKVLNFLREFSEEKHEIVSENIMNIVNELNSKMFLVVDLDEISEEALMKLEINEEQFDVDKMEALKLLREIVLAPREGFDFKPFRARIAQVPNPYREQLRAAIVNLCIRDIAVRAFGRVILGFDIEAEGETVIDFLKFFPCVYVKGGEDVLIDLFKWISNKVNLSLTEQYEFKRAIAIYLKSSELEVLNTRNKRDELIKTVKGYMFKEVIDEIGGNMKVFNGFKSKLGGILGKSPDE